MLRLDLWPTPAKPLTGSVQTRFSVSATVSAPGTQHVRVVDHSNKSSSWHALIEPHVDRPQPVTCGIEKSYDASDFIFELREKAVSRHIASDINGRSTIDRTTGHPGYAISPDLYSFGDGSAPACSSGESAANSVRGVGKA